MAKHVKNAIKAVAVFIVIGTIASVFAAPFMGGCSAAFSTILSPTALSLACPVPERVVESKAE